MKKFLILIIFFVLSSQSNASIKENIIKNLKNINNLSFKFEQNINGKIENGDCIIQYPKKIFCTYNQKNKKILVSNGKSIVIKTTNGYYIYPIKKRIEPNFSYRLFRKIYPLIKGFKNLSITSIGLANAIYEIGTSNAEPTSKEEKMFENSDFKKYDE